MPENRDVWEVLQAGSTQIRVAGMGGTIGFDYNALARLADNFGVDTPRAFWKKIQAVEVVIRRNENKQREQDEQRRKAARPSTPRRR